MDTPARDREFDELYRQHHDFVRSCLRRFRLADDGLDDAVHDVFVAMLGHAGDSWDRARAVRPWLFGISRRVALGQRRRFARRARLGVLATADAAAPLPDELLARTEATKILAQFIDGLDADKLAPFVLSEVEGLPARDVAARLGLSVTTVRWRVRAARARLETIAAEHSPRRLPAVIVWLWPWHSARIMPSLTWVLAASMVVLWLMLSSLRNAVDQRATTDSERVVARPASASTPRVSRVVGSVPPPLPSITASVGGRVVDEHGTPIAHALVCAERDPFERTRVEEVEPSCIETGVDGRYRLDGIMAGRHRIGATAAGFVPSEYAGPTRAGGLLAAARGNYHDIDVVLTSGGAKITGTVLDANGGVVPAAWVRGRDFTRFGTGWTARAVADDEGRFELWAPRGPLAIRATAPGYASSDVDANAPQSGLELRLMPEVTLSGRVVDASGAPIPGMRVSANSDEHNAEEQFIATISDVHGNFVLTRLRPGRYRPIATSAGFHGEAPWGVLATLEAPAPPIEIVAEPAHALQVAVTSDPTLPTGCDGEWIDALGPSPHATHIEGGSARFEGLLPGTYNIRTECHGVTVERAVVIATDDVELELHVPGGPALIGRIVGDAKLARFMWITAIEQIAGPDGRTSLGHAAETQTAADGRFVVVVGPPGTYALRGSTTDGTRLALGTFEVAKARHLDVGDIALPSFGRIVGTVIDSDGNAVGGLTVAARGAGLGTTTRPDGSFELVDVMAGTYALYLRRWHVEVDIAADVEVVVDADAVATVEISVPRFDGELAGHVVTADGAPLADAAVRISVVQQKESAERLATVALVHTDVDGRFAASDLPRGTYDVSAVLGGLDWASQRVRAGESYVVLTCGERSSLAGRVVDARGEPMTAFQLRIAGAGGELERPVRSRDGSWRVPDLPPGEYEVEVTSIWIEGMPRCRSQTRVSVGDAAATDVVSSCV